MKKIKIELKVGKIYAPKKISVFISNLENDRDDKYFESQKSFYQEFEVTSGRYVIKVLGMNQIEDTTTVSVGGDFEVASKKSSTKENYVIMFIGNVN